MIFISKPVRDTIESDMTEQDKRLYDRASEIGLVSCMLRETNSIIVDRCVKEKLSEDFLSTPICINLFNMLMGLDYSTGEEAINILNLKIAAKNLYTNDFTFNHICDIYDYTETPSMYLEYIYAVQRKWNVRKLNEIGRTISEDSTQEGIDIDEAVKSLESRIVEIGNIGDKQGALSMRQILEDGEDELFGETAMDLGILSGYPDLDAVSCGFKNGEMIVLAGRPSTGKSALITNIMNNLINHDVSALYFSLEMNKRELSCRMLSIRSKVRLDAIMKKRMSNNDKTQVRSAFNELKELPFVIDDEPKRSIEEIRALTRSMITKHRIDILFIDYLQLVTPSDPRDRREEQVSHMSRNIKLMSRELNIPVFVIAQLNRNIESDSKITRLPRLSDLRESGAIEQDADKVIFLSKNTEHPGASEDRWVIDVTVGKNRNGPTGTRQLMFDRSYVKFYSLSKDEGNPF